MELKAVCLSFKCLKAPVCFLNALGQLILTTPFCVVGTSIITVL